MNNAQLIKAAREILLEGKTATLATIIGGNEHVGAKLLIDDKGTLTGNLGDDELSEIVSKHSSKFLSQHAETITIKVSDISQETSSRFVDTRIMFERVEPTARLVICGAGHVGASLAHLGAFTGFEVSLIDDRDEYLLEESFPEKNINTILTKDWLTDVKEKVGAGHNVYIAVVTRGHKEDALCLSAILKSNPNYVGMIGSRKRTQAVFSNLIEEGFEEKVLETVHAPIGLDIGAVSPEEVAVAIMAEIIAVRRGGSGESLSKLKITQVGGY